ncbi:hypothetical protein L3V79_08580 [Thiotrichales bacterium 19S9-12]|nr:hypothetical protein [Thiotrichales bacterium 19S9-11]MCF6812410.1 hypothetical protein [Thiotrichales bacterium 19S9-12]
MPGDKKESTLVDPMSLQLISIAIVKTVREFVKYSDNLCIINNSTSHELKDFRKSVYNKLEEIRHKGQSLSDNEIVTIVLNSQIGNCGECSRVAYRLAQLISIEKFGSGDSIYISILFFTADHAICLLHQSETLASATNRQVLASNLEELLSHAELTNAVIIDPWSYRSLLLKNFKQYTEEYKFCEIGHLSTTKVFNKVASPRDYHEEKLYNTFQKIYLSLERSWAMPEDIITVSNEEIITIYRNQEKLEKLFHDLKFDLKYSDFELINEKRPFLDECYSFRDLCALTLIRRESGTLHWTNTTDSAEFMLQLLNSEKYKGLRIIIYANDNTIRIRDLRRIAVGKATKSSSSFFLDDDDKSLEKIFKNSQGETPQVFLEKFKKEYKEDLFPIVTSRPI